MTQRCLLQSDLLVSQDLSSSILATKLDSFGDTIGDTFGDISYEASQGLGALDSLFDIEQSQPTRPTSPHSAPQIPSCWTVQQWPEALSHLKSS